MRKISLTLAICFLWVFTPSLMLTAQTTRLVLPQGHGFATHDIKFSTNGNYIATASQDKTIKLWDARTGRLLNTLQGHKNHVRKIWFTQDGAKLFSTSDDGSTKVWDVFSGRQLYSLPAVFEKIYSDKNQSRVFLLDGSTYKLPAWDINTGKSLYVIERPSTSIDHIDISSDGQFLATASLDSLRLWSTMDGQLLDAFLLDYNLVTDLKFTPSGELLVGGREDGTVSIWDYKKGRPVQTLASRSGKINAVKVSPNSERLLAESDSAIFVWDLPRGTLTHSLTHPDFVYDASDLSPNGEMLLTVCADKWARLWNVVSGRVQDSLRITSDNVLRIGFSPDGQKAFVADGTNSKIWNLATKEVLSLQGRQDEVLLFEFSPDGNSLIYAAQIPEGDYAPPMALVNVETGAIMNRLEGITNMVERMDFTPDGRAVLLTPRNGKSNLFSLKELKVEHAFGGALQEFVTASFSADSRHLITADNGHDHSDLAPRLWDVSSGRLLNTYTAYFNDYASPDFSPDGKRILCPTYNDVIVRDFQTGAVLKTLTGHTDKVTDVAYSPDGKWIASSSNDQTVRLWDAVTFKPVAVMKGHSRYIYSLSFSPSGHLLRSSGGDGIIKVWQVPTGKLLYTFEGATNGTFMKGGAWLGTSNLNSMDDVKIWDLSSGAIRYNLTGSNPIYARSGKTVLFRDSLTHVFNMYDLEKQKKMFEIPQISPFDIRTVVQTPDEKTLLVSYMDNSVKWLDAQSGKEILTFVTMDSTDYLALLPSGYYASSPNAAKRLHYVTGDLKIISFEQLDIKYNRPDKLLEAIGSTDTARINAYRRAYEKRIRKLGVDTTSFREGFGVPEADFANRDAMALEQKERQVAVRIQGQDSAYTLDRFNVWINEVPLFGLKGISLRERRSHTLDTTITVNLSMGANALETSVTNMNGTESYRMPLQVTYTPKQPKGEKLHFVGIGIDRFRDARHNLQWSVKDIRDLALNLKSKYGEAIVIDTLFNEAVTVENVTGLKKGLLATSEDDKVLVSYSGHGLLSKDYDYYLSTYGVNFQRPEEDGLPYDALESLLDSIPARKKLMLIDACHSGEVDKEELKKIAAVNQSASTTKGAKGVAPLLRKDSRKVGMKNSFELMQELFVNVGHSTGATVISAAGGTQFALERGDLKNGVFTYSILEFLRKHSSVTVSQLKQYVNQRVPELTQGAQVPTTRNETKQAEWRVW